MPGLGCLQRRYERFTFLRNCSDVSKDCSVFKTLRISQQIVITFQDYIFEILHVKVDDRQLYKQLHFFSV
jgi:hypothetical protein